MNRRRLLGLGVAGLVVAGAGASAWRVGAAGAQAPARFAALAERFRTFTTLWMGFTLPRWETGRALGIVLRARSDGVFVLDKAPGGNRRWRWDGSRLMFRNRVTSLPATPVGVEVDAIISDIWREVRAGFLSCAAWLERPPLASSELMSDYPWTEWTRVDLPFVWARGMAVYLGFSTQDDRLLSVHVVDTSVNAPVSVPLPLGQGELSAIAFHILFDVPLEDDLDTLDGPGELRVPCDGPDREMRYTCERQPRWIEDEESKDGHGPDHTHGPGMGRGHDHGYGFEPGHEHDPNIPVRHRSDDDDDDDHDDHNDWD